MHLSESQNAVNKLTKDLKMERSVTENAKVINLASYLMKLILLILHNVYLDWDG